MDDVAQILAAPYACNNSYNLQAKIRYKHVFVFSITTPLILVDKVLD